MPENYASEHERVLSEANKIYLDKSHMRGQMWLDYPPSDKIRELRERIDRLERLYARREDIIPDTMGPEIPQAGFDKHLIEDSLDIINYAAFLIKQVRRGMRG